jgi:hypothetical protein
MENLAHSASFHSGDKSAPSKPGIKHLVQQGRINAGASKGLLPEFGEGSSSRQTHALADDGDGTMVLIREHFDCGFCYPRLGRLRLTCAEIAF